MKLKTIFIIFNILIAISFLVVFLMPAIFLGWEYAGLFWNDNWYLVLLFFAVLFLLNAYFLVNKRLFTALEREDWDAVISVLEDRVFQKKRYNQGTIRLLVNAYVIRSKSDRIRDLENAVREHRPKLLPRYALLFGVPHLLSNNGPEITGYYEPFLDTVSGADGNWIRWSYAFGLMLQERSGEARETLEELCRTGKDPIVRALSSYLMEAYAESDDSVRAQIDECRASITAKYSIAEWRHLVEKKRGELYVLILSKLLNDVADWLYKED